MPAPTDAPEPTATPHPSFRPSATTVAEGDTLALRALRVTAFDHTETLHWRTDDGILSMWVDCSDVFAWGTADAEELTSANIDLFEQTFTECEALFGKHNATWAPELFCARVRHMRPQGAFYRQLDNPAWTDLFHATGPERPVDLLNPYPSEKPGS